MKYLLSGAAIIAMSCIPLTANAQLIGGLDNNTLLGGAIGAGIGGAVGSNLAGTGVQDEGTAIGAVVGGLAGAAYANSQSNYYGNPYAGSFNPGFNTRNLAGTAIGAGLGGALGSNLAGSGQRQEGTAIGALLGGAAGYALANQSGGPRSGGHGSYAPGYGGPGYGGPGYGGPGYGGPGFGAPGYVGPVYGGPGYNGPAYTSSRYGGGGAYEYGYQYGHQWGGASAAPVMPAPSVIHSGQYIAGPIIPVTTQYVQPQTVYTAPINHGFTYADSSLRLSGPPLTKRVVRHSTYVEHAPTVRAERVVVEGNCPAGTSRQYNGTCLDPTITALPPLPRTNTRSTCPSGTHRQSDGICLNPSVTVLPPPFIAPPKRAVRHYAPAPKVKYHHPAPIVKHHTPAPVIHHKRAKQYCYPGSNKRYDRRGHLITSGSHCSG